MLRIDIVSIFPEYLRPLDLSLAGKARERGLLDIRVHDLRDWAHDRHQTVDDAPTGGGAGMVMRPEPWGEALDALGITSDVPLDGVLGGAVAGEPSVAIAVDGPESGPENGPENGPGISTLIVPSPSGEVFDQSIARELANRHRLVIACGRYEGIDQRVIDYAAARVEVREISLGDYVLNGGEVAALAIVEAVARLLPGFVGNAESLVEESHEAGLLEYPCYTKPRSWRGLDVPEVLLSGDHGAIASWRRHQATRRTIERRPDLRHPSEATEQGELRLARPSDAGELMTLQRACWVQEQQANPTVEIPPLHESLTDVRAWLSEWTVLVLHRGGRLIGAARGRAYGEIWDIGRLMVAPDLQGAGVGRFLLRAMEDAAPGEVTAYELFTGVGSVDNIRMYQKAGYRRVGWRTAPVPGAVRLVKQRASASAITSPGPPG
ncbi:MAG: tRNA (guanosine(37)-N1)-methyltransferase TrmD [Nocardioides sp.]